MKTSLFSCIHAHLPLQFAAHSLIKTSVSYSPQQTLGDKTAFSGRRLTYREQFHPWDSSKTSNYQYFPAISVVEWKKDRRFDVVIDREKRLQLFLNVRKLLLDQPNRTMRVKDLGPYRRKLFSPRYRKTQTFLELLRLFPGAIEIINDCDHSPIFRMTEEAEKLYSEELRLTAEMECWLVVKLRKLLMMSLEKRILLKKIGFLKADLGLPDKFGSTICHHYPQYFKVVDTEKGLALELTHWEPAIAVSAAEIKEGDARILAMERKTFFMRFNRFDRINLPNGLRLSGKDFGRLLKMRRIPFISPYSDFSGLRFNTLEKEKHSCAVIHEILSLTVEKRTLVRNLFCFRNEFRFPHQLMGLLIRHPEMFYVSMKKMRKSVFLREGYFNSQLVDKDKKFLVKERLRVLLSRCRNLDADDDVKGMSAIDELVTNNPPEVEDDDCSNENGCDDSDDDDDEVPPDFSDGDVPSDPESNPQMKKVGAISGEKKVVFFPNGQPRECW